MSATREDSWMMRNEVEELISWRIDPLKKRIELLEEESSKQNNGPSFKERSKSLRDSLLSRGNDILENMYRHTERHKEELQKACDAMDGLAFTLGQNGLLNVSENVKKLVYSYEKCKINWLSTAEYPLASRNIDGTVQPIEKDPFYAVINHQVKRLCFDGNGALKEANGELVDGIFEQIEFWQPENPNKAKLKTRK